MSLVWHWLLKRICVPAEINSWQVAPGLIQFWTKVFRVRHNYRQTNHFLDTFLFLDKLLFFLTSISPTWQTSLLLDKLLSFLTNFSPSWQTSLLLDKLLSLLTNFFLTNFWFWKFSVWLIISLTPWCLTYLFKIMHKPPKKILVIC